MAKMKDTILRLDLCEHITELEAIEMENDELCWSGQWKCVECGYLCSVTQSYTEDRED